MTKPTQKYPINAEDADGVVLDVLDSHTLLCRDPNTGIAWVEDGRAGCAHTAHPSIHHTGLVPAMKSLGYWLEDDEVVLSRGLIFNISHCVVHDDYDLLAAEHCLCGGNHNHSYKKVEEK